MSTQRPAHLQIDPDALSAVTFALQRTIDDLEARALVATVHEPNLGPSSAAEYRADIERLAGLLGQLDHRAARPDPERAAVVWFDAVYTIDEQRRPVRMIATARLNRLLEKAAERRHDGRLTPGVVIDLVAEATGSTALDVAEQLTAARPSAPNDDREPARESSPELSRRLSGPDRSTR